MTLLGFLRFILALLKPFRSLTFLFAWPTTTFFTLFVFTTDGAQVLFGGARGFCISFKLVVCLPISDFNGSPILVPYISFLPAILYSGSWLETCLLSISRSAVASTAPLTWALFTSYVIFLSVGSVSVLWVAPRLLSSTRWLLGHVTAGSCVLFAWYHLLFLILCLLSHSYFC